MDAIELGKLRARLAFAIEELNHAHAADVFLQKCVDAGDGRAYPAIGVTNSISEDPGAQKKQRHHGKGGQRQFPVHLQHDEDEKHQKKHVVHHGRNARGKQIVQRVHVGGYPRNQAADWAAVVKTYRQPLQVFEDFLAHVVHGVLADLLHDTHLEIHEGKAQN